MASAQLPNQKPNFDSYARTWQKIFYKAFQGNIYFI